MTALTPLYQIPFLEPGQPLGHTRAVMEAQSKRLEEVLSARGVPPTAGDIAALRTDVTALQNKTTVVPATTATMPYQKSQVDTLLGSTATIDELMVSTYLGDITANWYQLFIAPFPCRVASVSLMTQVAVASSATNYFTIGLRRARTTTVEFAKKTTNAADGAGGQAITAYTDWNFDNITFLNNWQTFAKGDGLLLTAAITGTISPASLTRSTVTVRYVPL